MPRIDHDHDDDLDLDPRDRRPAGWPRRLLVGLLALCGLVLGFLIPYTLYLNHQVTQKFGKLQWQVPTRVYARPLVLRNGMAMDAQTLRTELSAASYRDDGAGKRPGTYRQSGGSWRIASRGYYDVDGRIAPTTVQVSLSGGAVVGLRDLAKGQNLRSARMDPARIATLYGQQQEERRLVRLDEVPELMVTGLQAVEDRDFNRHMGVDLSGIARAMLVNLRNREFSQGGSTLTQLLARSGLLGIGKEQTLTRKFNEILYALLIEAHYDKRTILETFLNQVYLGQRGAQGIFGVAAAADYWFGRDLGELSTEQVALLIGMVKGPNWYDPRRNPERATERRNFVLGEMRETGLIEDAEYQRAVKAPLGVSKPGTNSVANPFPAYVDVVRRQLARDYPADAIAGAGLTVMTGMAPSAQGYAEGAVARQLKAISRGKRPPLQAGVVMTDVHSGEVVAVVGSRTAGEFGFNRAIDAQRPVGSIIKPFVYLLALAQPGKWSLASWVQDTPVTVALGRGRDWRPGNSDGRSHGSVRAIDALAQSYNQATCLLYTSPSPRD